MVILCTHGVTRNSFHTRSLVFYAQRATVESWTVVVHQPAATPTNHRPIAPAYSSTAPAPVIPPDDPNARRRDVVYFTTMIEVK